MPRRRRRLAAEPEEEGNDRWLVTYADMVTLLMVLFIVMFAMSSVDQQKYHALKNGLTDGFGRSADAGARGTSVVGEATPTRLAALDREAMSRLVGTALAEAEASALRAETARLEGLRGRLSRALAGAGVRGDARFAYDERGLVLSLVSRHVVFRNDVATLTTYGARVVDAVAPVLRTARRDVSVDGHTNQVDVQPAFYPTDWDLSAARAVTVLRRLHEHGGVPATRLSLAGFGAERPLLDPDQPRSQEVNKRVDLVLIADLPSRTRGLVEPLVDALDLVPGEDPTPTATPDAPSGERS